MIILLQIYQNNLVSRRNWIEETIKKPVYFKTLHRNKCKRDDANMCIQFIDG